MKTLSLIAGLVLATLSLSSAAQHHRTDQPIRLRGAVVWEYDDQSILVRYNNEDRLYYPVDQGDPGPGPVPPGRCPSRVEEPPLSRDSQLHREQINPSRTAGGTEYTIDLTRFHLAKKVQIRVLRGAVQIHGAELVKKYEGYIGMPELTVNRLCEGQAITVALNSAALTLTSLNLRLEGYHQNDVAVEILVQYDNAKCGGCNSYGCWIAGAGCNSYGCWTPGGNCNSYGCFVAGGGCNSYGCWYPGGSCNSYGCQKEARDDAGEMPSKPVCE